MELSAVPHAGLRWPVLISGLGPLNALCEQLVPEFCPSRISLRIHRIWVESVVAVASAPRRVVVTRPHKGKSHRGWWPWNGCRSFPAVWSEYFPEPVLAEHTAGDCLTLRTGIRYARAYSDNHHAFAACRLWAENAFFASPTDTSASRLEISTYALWRSNGRAYTIVSRLVYRSSDCARRTY
jgi:hypothetical protein